MDSTPSAGNDAGQLPEPLSGLLSGQPAGPLTAGQLRELYSLMVAVRHLDTSAIAWQRQGLIPGYAPELGQEAAQVGSGYAVDTARDFVFPTYREMGVARAMGVDMVAYMSTHKATWHGGLYDPLESRLAPIQAVVAGSVLHAVGWAHGQTLDQTDGVAMAYFGDGASSQGDVHEAMNFAAVMRAPVVFFVQNNGWAISVPTERQVAGGSVAARAAGYGIPALRIDGNDVVAVVDATRRAFAHARAGHGPVLIEAMTYRRGPHSTSDDPGRYRSLNEERDDAGEDPLERFRKTLLADGVADEAFFAEALAAAKAEEEHIRAGIQSLGSRPGTEMFDLVFQETTPALQAQAANWREESEHV
ncbi:pyruvate dehydrogenase E1 component alpha subunit [Arthrobacter sp. PvP102]|uniref:thiamine pyrophosphate-dependent dehydrogenase E1 component subunit alpha n=1 Tax=unclassified Arthrobacter TaxID=235627 RepID=UPI001B52CEBD|nr:MULTISPECIES: thiamine pyrophosphate-dependent dehydrogenase E1 component subunit alpha [unclassified Arthrobacter]MBP1231872.1 pyruvate dehydrogenase E1 component alpha subunit [Arthrobacter sp. PvP103]MBP1237007.1 pyruvate dehydrogenase E1 component alpha subunit [Arthrobacter sp. PvP102]